MNLSLFLAVDFSLGNKHYKNPYSLHYINDKVPYIDTDSDDGDMSPSPGSMSKMKMAKKKLSWA